MSNASPQVIEYLTRQLSRNPIHESGEIVRARAKAFKLEQQATPPASISPPSGQRQKVRDELEKIREQCFTGPVNLLLGSLSALPLAEYPDLAVLAYRLRVILDSRAKLPALSQNPHFDGDFFSVVKQVLVSPARDVAVLREQVLASFRYRRNRKRAQAMIRLLEAEAPGLYALEADWFRSLSRYRGSKYLWGAPRRDKNSPTTQSAANETGNWPIWIFVVVTLALVRSIMASVDHHQPSRNPTPYRVPSAQGSAPSKPLDNALQGLSETQQQQRAIHEQMRRRAKEIAEEHRRAMEVEQEQARKRIDDYFNNMEEEDREFLKLRPNGSTVDPSKIDSPPDFGSSPFATPPVVPMPAMPSTSPRP